MLKIFIRFSLLIGMLMLVALISACATTPKDESDGKKEDEGGSSEIKIPDSADNLRESVHFADIKYERPDIEALRSAIENAISSIEANNTSFDQQMSAVKAIDLLYESFVTMHTYATIRTYANSTDAFYTEELAILDEEFPAIAKLLEDMTVAAATSPHAVRFESDYFGDGLVEKYANGGMYTDELVNLFADEAELEARYNSVSTATVTITYSGRTDTCDNLIKEFCEAYGENSTEFKSASYFCHAAYQREAERIYTDIFIELLKTRRKIADALGYDSYIEYAYDVTGHDYDPAKTEKFLGDISKYVVPVYSALSTKVFGRGTHSEPILDRATVLNTVSGALEEIDEELIDVYTYMLTYGLYDIKESDSGRFDGSFTAYLEGYDAPYMFVTSQGGIDDYMTVSHEFGHFYDYFLNGGQDSSLDLMEISSQGLELLVLSELRDVLSWRDYKRLYYSQMEDMLLVFIFQGLYSKFEHNVYELSYYEITEDRINSAVAEAAEAMSLNSAVYNELSDVMIPHIFLEPLYVQSYCTSLATSLEIFFAEMNDSGSGYEIYNTLLDRHGYVGFEEQLRGAGLMSPFDEGVVKKLADSIYYSLLGSHFFDEYKGTPPQGTVYVYDYAYVS